MRDGINCPKFADKFFRIDFEASPMPVLCLYPIPAPMTLEELRIEVCGLEQHPRVIGWGTLGDLPRVKLRIPLICQIFNWSEVVEWEGIRLVDFLDFFKVETHPEGYYALYSRDGVYFETLSRDEARDPRVLLAYGLNGSPLPEAHGGPLRLVVPFLQGYKSVKWIGSIRAFRNDPIGIKRLLGQSPTGQLNEAWLKKFGLTLPEGKQGDPPLIVTSSPGRTEANPVEIASPSVSEYRPVQAAPSEASARPAVITRSQKLAVLREIIAIVRPQKHEETRRALEGAGIVSYTTLTVLGRSRQRGLRFPSDQDKQEVAIKFLPKQLFSIVVEGGRVQSAVNAIVKANRTGKGQYGDGKIFVLELDEVVRVSTDERGEAAV